MRVWEYLSLHWLRGPDRQRWNLYLLRRHLLPLLQLRVPIASYRLILSCNPPVKKLILFIFAVIAAALRLDLLATVDNLRLLNEMADTPRVVISPAVEISR